MASFRTHFKLRDEEINVSPSDYADFWYQASNSLVNKKKKFCDIRFLHKADNRDIQLSRFRSVDKDSLLRPLHILELNIKPNNKLLNTTWHQVVNKFHEHQAMLAKILLISDSVSVRIYNNSVALLQVDLDISDVINEQNKADIASQFDILQETGITFGECLSQALYRNYIKTYLDNLIKIEPQASRFIAIENFEYKNAVANAILTQGSTEDNQSIKVNWVTRTLLVESEGENNLNAIIDHWLKDCGHQETVDIVKRDPEKCAIRWLNYVFREKAYSWKRNEDGTISYGQPFCDEWQAMLNAQYYYAAFEALNDSLKSTLSCAYQSINRSGQKAISALRQLNRVLERDIIASNLTTIEYHNNYGYYNRHVGVTMKNIMAGWDFDEAILAQVKHNTILCEQRIAELHQKAASRSGFYSDILLLGIAVTSIVAFLFQVIEYGRNISHNADLAVYESNTWNLVELISERPTDFIITLSLTLIVILFALYSWFRRVAVMD